MVVGSQILGLQSRIIVGLPSRAGGEDGRPLVNVVYGVQDRIGYQGVFRRTGWIRISMDMEMI